MMEQIEQWIQKAQDCFDKEEFRGLINDMVNIPSPTGEELQIAQYCTDYLQKSGLKPELQMISGTQANAIGRYGSNSNSDGPELLLFANVDTHMGAIEEDKPWIGDPYPNILKSVAKWNGDIISGLGSENPKGYAASMMTAAACIAKAGVPLKGNLTVGLGAGGMTVLNRPGWDNKYIGAGNGALFMLQRSVTPDYCIFGKPGYYACWEEVGVCFFRVRLKGPGLGYAGARHILPDPNPIPHVARVIDAIEAWIPQYAARNSSGLVEPWGGISVINGGWPGRPLIAPAAIDLIVDLRLSPRSTVPDVLREFRSMLAEVAKDIPRLEIDVSIDLAIPGGHTPPDNWIVKSVISAWEATENKTHATPPRMSGYTDISVIRRWGIPAVRVGMPFSPDMIFGDEHNEADILPMNRMDINHAEKLVKLVIRSAVQTCMKSIEETRTS